MDRDLCVPDLGIRAGAFYRWVASSIIGIVDARHVIYIVLIGFLLVDVFHLTQTISSMADRMTSALFTMTAQ